MNKALTVFAIIGSASAANTVLRDQGTTLYYQKFPNYTTTAATLLTDLQYIESVFKTGVAINYGGYECARRGAIYAFPQMLTNVTKVQALSTAANTAFVTFYGADTAGAMLGMAAGTVALDANSATATLFLNHGCHVRIGTSTADIVTNVAPGYLISVVGLADAASTILANRPFYMGNHNQGIDTIHMAVKNGGTTYVWNNDFLLASMWQQGPNATATAVSATDFCTKNYSALDTATATYAASATGITGSGFNSQSKCTWQVKVKEAIGAPAFSVIAAKYTTFQLQWAEWEADVLTAKTDLVDTTNAAPFYPGISSNLGADAQWPNPINTYTLLGAAQATSNVSGDLSAYTDYNPAVNGYAGSPGMVKYYPTSNLATATILSVESYSTMDYMAVKGQYDDYNSQASTYNTSKDSYNTLKDAYNKQVKAEKERLADFFKAIFEPVTVIPERPCQPTRLAAIYAVDMDYTSTAAISLDSKKANKAVFTFDSVGQSVNASWRVGYLVASSSTAFVTTDYVGHVYGLLGQDIAQVTNLSTTPADTQKDLRAWQWKDAGATKAHYQMVSILPYEADGMTALTASETIAVTFTVVAFDTSRKITKPGQPDATSAPDAAIGANALAASAVAVAAVAASLF